MAHKTCAACRARVEPVRPSLGSKVAFYAALVPVLGMLLAYPFFGFLWTFIVPVVMLGGFGIGPLVDAAFAPATCPACERRFVAEPEEERLPEPSPATMLRS
jgi:hypothetical protein